MSSINFAELLPKASEWNVYDEEILLQKIKLFTEEYNSQIESIQGNMSILSRNLILTESNFYDTMNTLKGVAIHKFIEHVLDENEVIEREGDNEEEKKEETPQLTNDELQNMSNQLINNVIQNSINALPVKEVKEKEGEDDDTASITSSKLGNKAKKLKLPLIIGTNDFNASDYVGLFESTKNFEIEDQEFKQNVSGNEKEFIVEEDASDLPVPVPPPFPNAPNLVPPEQLMNPTPMAIPKGMGEEGEEEGGLFSSTDGNMQPQPSHPTDLASFIAAQGEKIKQGENPNQPQPMQQGSLFSDDNPQKNIKMPIMNPNKNLRYSNIGKPSEGGYKRPGVNLSNFVSGGFGEDDEDDDFDSRLFRHSSTIVSRKHAEQLNKRNKNTQLGMIQENIIENAPQQIEEEPSQKGPELSSNNLFEARDDFDQLPHRKRITSTTTFNASKAKNLLNFLDDDNEDMDNEDIASKSKKLAEKLNIMTDEPKKEEPKKVAVMPKPSFLNDDEDEEVKKPAPKKQPLFKAATQTVTNPEPVKTESPKKKKTLFDEDDEEEIVTKPKETMKPKEEPKKEEPKKPTLTGMFADIETDKKEEPKKEEPKKPTLTGMFADIEKEEPKKEETKKPVLKGIFDDENEDNISNKKEKEIPVKKEEPKEEIKPEHKSGKKKMFAFDEDEEEENNNKEKSQPSNKMFGSTEPKNKMFSNTEPSNKMFGSTESKNKMFSNPEPKNKMFGGTEPSNKMFGNTESKNKMFGGSDSKNKMFSNAEPKKKVSMFGNTKKEEPKAEETKPVEEKKPLNIFEDSEKKEEEKKEERRPSKKLNKFEQMMEEKRRKEEEEENKRRERDSNLRKSSVHNKFSAMQNVRN
ncbi:MAG: hypothetical protein MJ252_10740 [archaeon]|nr:hypothetical protein [archaeon]